MYLYLCTFLFLQAFNTCKAARCKSNGASEKEVGIIKLILASPTEHSKAQNTTHLSLSSQLLTAAGWRSLHSDVTGSMAKSDPHYGWGLEISLPFHPLGPANSSPRPISHPAACSRGSRSSFFPCSLLHLSSSARIACLGASRSDNNGARSTTTKATTFLYHLYVILFLEYWIRVVFLFPEPSSHEPPHTY